MFIVGAKTEQNKMRRRRRKTLPSFLPCPGEGDDMMLLIWTIGLVRGREGKWVRRIWGSSWLCLGLGLDTLTPQPRVRCSGLGFIMALSDETVSHEKTI